MIHCCKIFFSPEVIIIFSYLQKKGYFWPAKKMLSSVKITASFTLIIHFLASFHRQQIHLR